MRGEFFSTKSLISLFLDVSAPVFFPKRDLNGRESSNYLPDVKQHQTFKAIPGPSSIEESHRSVVER